MKRPSVPMRVETVWTGLDQITTPERIPSSKVDGAQLYPVGQGGERALGFYVAQWSSGKSGDHNGKAARRAARRKSSR